MHISVLSLWPTVWKSSCNFEEIFGRGRGVICEICELRRLTNSTILILVIYCPSRVYWHHDLCYDFPDFIQYWFLCKSANKTSCIVPIDIYIYIYLNSWIKLGPYHGSSPRLNSVHCLLQMQLLLRQFQYLTASWIVENGREKTQNTFKHI